MICAHSASSAVMGCAACQAGGGDLQAGVVGEHMFGAAAARLACGGVVPVGMAAFSMSKHLSGSFAGRQRRVGREDLHIVSSACSQVGVPHFTPLQTINPHGYGSAPMSVETHGHSQTKARAQLA
jgi:hypothetical protein